MFGTIGQNIIRVTNKKIVNPKSPRVKTILFSGSEVKNTERVRQKIKTNLWSKSEGSYKRVYPWIKKYFNEGHLLKDIQSE